METVRNIIAEKGEDCRVDIDMLEDGLSKLPTAAYIELYHKMQTRLYGYPNFGGCCSTVEEKKAEIKVETDFSEVQDALDVAEELHVKLNEVNRLISEIAGRRISATATME